MQERKIQTDNSSESFCCIRKGLKQPMKNIWKSLKYRMNLAALKKEASENYKIRKPVKNVNKIRVGFINQLPSCWGSLEPVYEAMKQSDDFEPVVLAVNSFDQKAWKLTDQVNPEVYEQVPEALTIQQSDGSHLSLEDLDLDYLFYQRPYDYYLPEYLRSREANKVTRCCYIPYGYWTSANNNETRFVKTFMTNMTFVFAENQDTVDTLNAMYPRTVQDGYQHFIMDGYPVLENIRPMRQDPKKAILWAPRWTTDEQLGGSSFFLFKDEFIKFAKEHPDLKLIIRPHPLAFGHYMATGQMTEEDVRNFKEELKKANIVLDEQPDYLKTFDETQILISDLSAITIPWLLSEKPLIQWGKYEDMISEMLPVLKSVYMVQTWDDVQSILDRLIKQDDWKKNERIEAVDKVLNHHHNASERILEDLRKDAINSQRKAGE